MDAMRKTLNVRLPEDMRSELDRVSVEKGISRSAIVRKSLRDFFFSYRSGEIRKRLLIQAERRGICTDEDVFKQVS